MLASKYENLLVKTNEDILEKKILEVEGLSYFNKSEKYLLINNKTYYIWTLTINDLIDLIVQNNGTVSIKDTDYLNYPSFILGNYSSILYYLQEESPIDLKKITYRYSDLEYDYKVLNSENYIIKNGILSSKENKHILKVVKRFSLFKMYDEYIGS